MTRLFRWEPGKGSWLALFGVVAALLWFVYSAKSGAAASLHDGDPDPSFGGIGASKGMVTVGFTPTQGFGNAVARQSDGKLVVAGFTGQRNYPTVAVTRLNADGTLDTSFGVDGRFTLYTCGGAATAVLIQPSGKIVVGGHCQEIYSDNTTLLRLTPDGALDTSFATDGTGAGDVGPVVQLFNLPTGDFLVAGGNGVARYSADGVLDTSFGQHGVYGNGLAAVALQANGKIVGAQSEPCGCPKGDAILTNVWRSNSDGSPDTTFGDNGGVLLFSQSPNYVTSLVVLPDGKIRVAGGTALIFGLNADGSTDNDFGGGSIGDGSISGFARLILLPKNEIAALWQDGFTLKQVRYREDGSQDNTFGANGVAVVNLPPHSNMNVNSATLDPSGEIVVTGEVGRVVDELLQQFMQVVSITGDGALDPAFARAGVATVFFPGPGHFDNEDSPFGLVVQPDGKIVVVGESASYFAAIRLNTDGSLDSGFGNGGRVVIDDGQATAVAYGVALQTDGKIVLVGGDGPAILLARLNSDGSLDDSFGSDPTYPGVVRADLTSGNDMGSAVRVQPDGKIVVGGEAGSTPTIPTSGYILARFNSNGALDTTFNQNGFVFASYGDYVPTSVQALALQPDGKIVITSTPQTIVARYNPDGSIDRGFGHNGSLTIFGPDVYDLSLAPNGEILLVGSSQANNGVFVRRLLPNGAIDFSFGANGLARIDYGVGNPPARIAALAGGKIMVGGWGHKTVDDGRYLDVIVMARLNADGSLDTAFGDQGTSLRVVNDNSADNGAMTLQANGAVVFTRSINIPSTHQYDSNNDMLVMRFLNSVPPASSAPQPTPTPVSGCVFSDVCSSDYFMTRCATCTVGALFRAMTIRPFGPSTTLHDCNLARSW